MGTNITPEVSKKSKYWISRHRYYELKHFCLQWYNWHRDWKDLLNKNSRAYLEFVDRSIESRNTETVAMKRAELAKKMDMIRVTAMEADVVIGNYIFDAVTQNLSYTYLRENRNIPCSKNEYYELYRRFFWLLDKKRN